MLASWAAAFRLFDRMALLLRGRVVYFGERGAPYAPTPASTLSTSPS